jgi:hypothetical protein
MAELDALKKTRIAGLMLRRDWGKQDPWPTYPKEGEIDLTHMSRKVKELIRAAGVCTENLIRVDDVTESLKLAE